MAISVAVIGAGVVGGTLIKWFYKNTDHKVSIYDPDKGYKANLLGCEYVFICVPVPTRSDYTQDTSILEDSINICSEKSMIFCRSTVLPGTCDKLGITALPEFLTARFAYEEMSRLDIIVGLKNYQEFMLDIFPEKRIHFMTNREAEIVKYTHNVYGAMKINYFNIINELCELHKADYKKVIQAMAMTGFHDLMYTEVPGPDGSYGFGGTCFPKDLEAFYGLTGKEFFSAILKDNSFYRKKINKN